MRHSKKNRTSGLMLGALGIVFGDIGTNPLYAVQQCFHALNKQSVDPASVLGILSLIFWSLILVVCVKYLTFILRADHEGEGGTLAMLARIHLKKPAPPTAAPGALILMVLFGSALLYGDGAITPAISVLSAVEGLKTLTPRAGPFIVPVALAILIGLFLVQSRGSGSVGKLFGPVIALWFLVIAALGLGGIVRAPQVLAALNPLDGFLFITHHGWTGFLVLGGVVLCFSGAEALFADLGHFGRRPILLGWYGLVFPSLVLNYFGQGALLLLAPTAITTSFYALVPHLLLAPVLVLATLATIIASQALISGVFSLTAQAIRMGYFPRLEIVHTSKTESGQIYIAPINYFLMLTCIGIVLGFRSSERLGGAYGLAVIGTMTITSLTYFLVLRKVWKWPLPGAIALVGSFLALDLMFLAGNVVKLLDGAWVPLVIGLFVFSVFWIWTEGRATYHRALNSWSMPVENFVTVVKGWKERNGGTGIFLTTRPDYVPLVGKSLWLRQNVRPDLVLLITIVNAKVPFVATEQMIKTEELTTGFWRVTASFGFMQHPDVSLVLKNLPPNQIKLDWERLVVYLPEPCFVAKGGWWHQRIEQIFDYLGRNSLSPARYFRVPPREIIHVGMRLEI